MRILQPGNVQHDWPKQVTCRDCKAILEIEKEDCQIIENQKYDPTFMFLKVKTEVCECPFCKERIVVKDSLGR